MRQRRAAAQPASPNLAADHRATDRWDTLAADEEARVEIFRRGEPPSPEPGGRAIPPPATPPAFAPAPAYPSPDPTWIAVRDAEARSVVRRFLRALKRET